MQKIWAFLEKNYVFLFFRFYNCKPFEEGPGTNVSNTFLFNTTMLGYSVLNNLIFRLDFKC